MSTIKGSNHGILILPCYQIKIRIRLKLSSQVCLRKRFIRLNQEIYQQQILGLYLAVTEIVADVGVRVHVNRRMAYTTHRLDVRESSIESVSTRTDMILDYLPILVMLTKWIVEILFNTGKILREEEIYPPNLKESPLVLIRDLLVLKRMT